MASVLSVGEVAERSGVAVSAVHFYERQGLIQSKRNGSNHRRYSAWVLRRIAVIQVAQRAGIPLKEIRDAFRTLPSDTRMTAEDWAALSAAWKSGLDERIARLTRLRDQIAGCIGCGCLSMDKCALFNPDDIIGKNGSGPRYLEEDAHMIGKGKVLKT